MILAGLLAALLSAQAAGEDFTHVRFELRMLPPTPMLSVLRGANGETRLRVTAPDGRFSDAPIALAEWKRLDRLRAAAVRPVPKGARQKEGAANCSPSLISVETPSLTREAEDCLTYPGDKRLWDFGEAVAGLAFAKVPACRGDRKPPYQLDALLNCFPETDRN